MKKLGLVAAAAAVTASTAFAGQGIEINKFLTLGGFIDAGYTNKSKDFVGGASVDTSTFAVRQAEVDFKLNINEGLTARVDLQGGNGIDRPASTVTAGGITYAVSTPNSDAVSIEQARIDLDMGTWGLTLGKWDTYIGLESTEPTDMYQDTNSLLSELQPTQQTGINAKFKGQIFTVDLGIVNGLMTENPDRNDQIGFQGHVNLKPWEAWSFNLSYAMSQEKDGSYGASSEILGVDEQDTRLLAFDIQYQNYGFTVGAEYQNRTVDDGTSPDDEDTGWSLMVNYKFNEQFSLTGRVSSNEGKTGGDLSSITLAPIYAITPNWTVMAEYRADSGTGVAAGRDGAYSGKATGLTGDGNADATQISLKTTLSF